MKSELELRISISEEDAPDEYIDQITSSLILQLRDLNLDSLHKERNTKAPAGAKGDPITVGAVVLGISVAVLPNLIAFLQNWVGDRRKVVIEAPNGAKMEFVPEKKLTTDEILTLTTKLSQIPSKKQST